METQKTEYLLADGSYFNRVLSWVTNPDHPMADEDGRVYIARNDTNVDLTGAQELPEGTIEAAEAQMLADWDAAVAATEQLIRDREEARETEARAELAAAGLPQAAIDALIRLYSRKA